jgi:predicted RecB family nuclease
VPPCGYRPAAEILDIKDGTISSGIDVLTEANLKAADLDGYCDVLTKVSGTRHENPSNYEPTIVVGTRRIEKDQLFHLSFTGLVLGQIQGRAPAMGYLVTAGGERHRANLQPTYKIVGSIVERIRSWSTDSPAQPPAVILNKHCPYCPFKSTCTRLSAVP